MKKICHVCSAHSALDGRVFQRECVTLANHGYETHLIATSDKREVYIEQKVIVHPLPKIENSIQRMKRRFQVAKIAKELVPDLYHVHEPELLNPILQYAGNTPVVFDIHEAMWITMMERDWIPKIIRPSVTKLWDLRERYLIQKCAALIPATEQVASHYLDHHKLVQTITNYPDEIEMNSFPEVIRDGITCIFAGTLAPNRGVHIAIEAIDVLKKRGLRVPLVIVGSGSNLYMNTLKELIIKLGLSDLIKMVGRLSRPQTLQMLNNSSIGILSHIPTNNQIKVSIPVKLLEYMAMGLPVIYSTSSNHMNFVKPRPIGIGVDEVTPLSLANGIQWLVEHPQQAEMMGKNGKQSINEEFNWTAESKKLLQLYDKIFTSIEIKN